MEVPTGKCLSCGKMIPMWRCGDTTGGGTYHIVCLECNQRESRQSGPLRPVWRWVGWTLGTGFVMAAFYIVLVFGGAAYPSVRRPEAAFKQGNEAGDLSAPTLAKMTR